MSSVLQQLIHARRSIRRFKPDPVEKEKLLSCLEAARLAPSSENSQPWRFIVVDRPEIKDTLAGGAFSGIYSTTKFAAQAPALVVVLARLDVIVHKIGRRLQGTEFFLIDIGIAGEHFVLRAEELGLSTCWIGWFNVRRTRKLLRIPRKYKIVCLIAVGYAASRPPSETKRKPLNEIAWFNKIGE